jgi:hypothetical protein
VRTCVRRAVAQLTRAHLQAALCAAAAAFALLAATPAPKAPYRIDLTKIQPKALLPKVVLHSEYIVAVNKLGQVTHIISGKVSKDKTYNLQTYGNAMQAYIRTPDGTAVSGSYRLTYDYNPKTTRVRRDVELVRAGGVDANAPGAVTRMFADLEKHHKPGPSPSPGPARTAAVTPGPAPTGSLHLPDLKQIIQSPEP